MDNNLMLVVEKLKGEFFGIDEQIEQVVKSFDTWLSVKEYQTRPMTICLWGLTGTGKTALINRTIELMDLNKKKFYIKFGSKTSGIDEDFEQNTCNDTIFILDEFQYFKSIKEDGGEISRDEDNSTNMIWELLDGGIVNLYGQNGGYNYEKFQLSNSLYVLKRLDSFGATINNGIIFHNELNHILEKLFVSPDKLEAVMREKKSTSWYTRTINDYYHDVEHDVDEPIKQSGGDNSDVISKTEIRVMSTINVGWGSLFEYIRKRDIDYNFETKNELQHFFKNTNKLSDIINLLTAVIGSKPKLEVRDYSKSLIFVIGNLDECFTMAGSLTSDLDADYFYNETKKINIVNIRKALLSRFRAEQIARLGSTHIIYPSLNKEAFVAIINKELQAFETVAKQKFSGDGVKINKIQFSTSINQLIYKEGVFPIIGARSVFSVVTEIVADKFPFIIRTMLGFEPNKIIDINFDFDNKKNNITISFVDYNSGVLLCVEKFKYVIKVDNLRVETDKGKQTHRAVHEAGHAVCSIILEHSFPEVVYSVVLDNGSSGFNLLNKDDFYYHRKNTYMNRIATLLGGYAAEKIVFGDDNISNGSGHDIESATSLLTSLLKDCGFNNSTPARFVSKSFTSTSMQTSNYSVSCGDTNIDDYVVEKIKEALKIATETLNKQKLLFLQISKYLSKNPKMSNGKLKAYTKKYIKDYNYSDLLGNKQYFYVKMLDEQLNNF